MLLGVNEFSPAPIQSVTSAHVRVPCTTTSNRKPAAYCMETDIELFSGYLLHAGAKLEHNGGGCTILDLF